MKNLTLLFAAFIAVSCSCSILDEKHSYIQPKFRPYLDSFLIEANKRGYEFDTASDFTLMYGNLNDEGDCGLSEGALHTIAIDTTSSCWQSPQRWVLMYHEFGHYFLHRKHRQDFGADGYPASIMIAGYGFILMTPQRKANYIDELFSTKEVL